MKDKATIELGLIKEGTEDSQEPWVEMRNVSEIYEHACTLNDKDRRKMFKEFEYMVETVIAYKEFAETVSDEDPELEMNVFRWRND